MKNEYNTFVEALLEDKKDNGGGVEPQFNKMNNEQIRKNLFEAIDIISNSDRKIKNLKPFFTFLSSIKNINTKKEILEKISQNKQNNLSIFDNEILKIKNEEQLFEELLKIYDNNDFNKKIEEILSSINSEGNGPAPKGGSGEHIKSLKVVSDENALHHNVKSHVTRDNKPKTSAQPHSSPVLQGLAIENCSSNGLESHLFFNLNREVIEDKNAILGENDVEQLKNYCQLCHSKKSGNSFKIDENEGDDNPSKFVHDLMSRNGANMGGVATASKLNDLENPDKVSVDVAVWGNPSIRVALFMRIPPNTKPTFTLYFYPDTGKLTRLSTNQDGKSEEVPDNVVKYPNLEIPETVRFPAIEQTIDNKTPDITGNRVTQSNGRGINFSGYHKGVTQSNGRGINFSGYHKEGNSAKESNNDRGMEMSFGNYNNDDDNNRFARRFNLAKKSSTNNNSPAMPN